MNTTIDPSSLSNVTRAVRALCEGRRLSTALRIATQETSPTIPAPSAALTAIAIPRPCPECRGSGEVEREGKSFSYTVACRCRSSELPGSVR